MVKFTILPLAGIAALASLAAANNCKTGLNYCGYNLLGTGTNTGRA